MANLYRGKIKNNVAYDGHAGKITVINFMSTEEDTKGLSIFIAYEFKNEAIKESFIRDLESRLKKHEDSVGAEVSLTAKITREVSEYNAQGPIKFLDEVQ